MKFIKLFLNFNYFYIIFLYNFFKKFVFLIFTKNLYLWKISIYSDSYWFLYSNKKSLLETRYIF